jgi:hypothetical protein
MAPPPDSVRPPPEPRSPPVIHFVVCVGPRCDAEGKGRALLVEVLDALRTQFPADLAAGKIACSTRDCLRLCTRDPVVRLEPSGDAFSNPRIDDLLRFVAEALRACYIESDD